MSGVLPAADGAVYSPSLTCCDHSHRLSVAARSSLPAVRKFMFSPSLPCTVAIWWGMVLSSVCACAVPSAGSRRAPAGACVSSIAGAVSGCWCPSLG